MFNLKRPKLLPRITELSLMLALLSTTAGAQECTPCPADAGGTAVGTGFSIFVLRDGIFQNVTGAAVGECEELILLTSLNYVEDVNTPTGLQPGAAFRGGAATITMPDASIVDVTPDSLDAGFIIGPALAVMAQFCRWTRQPTPPRRAMWGIRWSSRSTTKTVLI